MGALGAFIMALARRKLSMDLLKQALDNTTRLSCFVLFILIGSTVFSFTFNAADGQKWVEHLFDKLPGGALGFLIVVNLLVFVLGMFIDFFEIAFIVIPLLAPVAEKLLPGILPPGSDALIWFGVIIAMNLQTSFLTPPFGFALFYLRSVAAKADYNDRVTNQRIPAVTTAQIYKGAIAFIVIQVVMVVAVIAWPHLVLDSLDKAAAVNIDDIRIEMPIDPDAEGGDQAEEAAEGEEEGEKAEGEEQADDPAKALMEQMK
jgi:TRAP-type mannitol/chloroaromatic compound transport system permease large subunit